MQNFIEPSAAVHELPC